jgi:alpha-N-arabinofuranosidase
VRAALSLDPSLVVAPVRRRTFGSFVEHMGRCVYSGIFEPGHPLADADGFRTDVLALVRELGVTLVRYPGGNFVSGYRWEDGVGPAERRPTRLDLAWHSLETNEFGLGEFMRWTARAGVEPMLAVNLGTRGTQEALDLLEYANHPGGTALSDLRRSHGAPDPYGVELWCLGNELDGPWQVGHKTAAEYGRLAEETGKAMRLLDPRVRLVAVGSSSSGMPTFGAWESTVLEHAYDQVDYVSCHAYYQEVDGDVGSFLASAVDMDGFIDAVTATADAVRARLGRPKRIEISFDEWNVWDQSAYHAVGNPTEWVRAPRLIEDAFSVTDAVVVGGLLISLLRHSDRVTAACQAQLVNVIAPIRAEPGGPAWRQTTFHPFAQAARLARGTVLRTVVDGPTYPTARFGDVPVVDAVATHDEATGDLALLAVNRSQRDEVTVRVDLAAFGGLEVAEATVVADRDRHATNTRDDPDRVVPLGHPGVGAGVGADGSMEVFLPPLSWNAIRLVRPGRD